jgi:predicted transglutaminase-like cysteine proteinase
MKEQISFDDAIGLSETTYRDTNTGNVYRVSPNAVVISLDEYERLKRLDNDIKEKIAALKDFETAGLTDCGKYLLELLERLYK